MEAFKQEARRITEFLVANHEYLSSEHVSPRTHVRREANFMGSGRDAIRAHASVIFPQSVIDFLSDSEVLAEVNDALSAVSEASFDPKSGWFTFLKD